jgi:hypothetical protein
MKKPLQFALNFRPMKVRDADTVKGTISDLYGQVAGGVKEVMRRFNIGKSQAYAYTDELTKEQISFAWVVSLTSPTATAAAEFLASRAGGVFCALPSATGDCPMTLTADSVREHGEAVAKALNALTGNVTPVKKSDVRKEIDEAICALAALRWHFVEDDQ